MRRLRVLLTGAAGRVGSCLAEAFREQYHLRTLDVRPAPGDPDTIVTDIQNQGMMKAAMRDIDVVVHLAAFPYEGPFHEVLVPNNVIGLYNTFQAAHEAGVRRTVFASSCQAVTTYPPDRTVSASDPVRPVTIYGATKVFGEVLGRYYHDHKGMEFVGIRIGWLLPYDAEQLRTSPYARRTWLSPRDAVKLFRLAVEKPDVGYAVVFGTSVTESEWLSLAEARDLLGYEPEDDVVAMYGPMTPTQPTAS